MTFARIIGTGSYVPEKVLTNQDLSRMLGEDIDEFVSQVIGIKERHICDVNESTADLATASDVAPIRPDSSDKNQKPEHHDWND